ncbi:MAG: hypothetical protein GY855_02600, partial [candidate division Zixibacteria bacterium]|nr:hypothetical protein [candidate division Zixibacteria bacterium]
MKNCLAGILIVAMCCTVFGIEKIFSTDDIGGVPSTIYPNPDGTGQCYGVYGVIDPATEKYLVPWQYRIINQVSGQEITTITYPPVSDSLRLKAFTQKWVDDDDGWEIFFTYNAPSGMIRDRFLIYDCDNGTVVLKDAIGDPYLYYSDGSTFVVGTATDDYYESFADVWHYFKIYEVWKMRSDVTGAEKIAIGRSNHNINGFYSPMKNNFIVELDLQNGAVA